MGHVLGQLLISNCTSSSLHINWKCTLKHYPTLSCCSRWLGEGGVKIVGKLSFRQASLVIADLFTEEPPVNSQGTLEFPQNRVWEMTTLKDARNWVYHIWQEDPIWHGSLLLQISKDYGSELILALEMSLTCPHSQPIVKCLLYSDLQLRLKSLCWWFVLVVNPILGTCL